MIQLLVGLVLGLILVAFFVAVMYYVLPDDAVDKALDWFENLWRDLLDTTIGRAINALLSPVTAMTSALTSFVMTIGAKAGPLAGFSVALLGLLRTSWGLMTIIDAERAMSSLEAMAKATVVLGALMALGTISWVAWQGLKSLFAMAMSGMARRKKSHGWKPRLKFDEGKALRLGYIVAVALALLFGIHVIHMAVEVMWPNSDTARILGELDLMEKFYLYVIKDIEIRRPTWGGNHMARKTGLVAIVMAIVLFFMAGIVTAWLTAMIQSWLGLDDEGRHAYILAGLSSLVGFAYWRLVARLGLKGMKKLIMG